MAVSKVRAALIQFTPQLLPGSPLYALCHPLFWQYAQAWEKQQQKEQQQGAQVAEAKQQQQQQPEAGDEDAVAGQFAQEVKRDIQQQQQEAGGFMEGVALGITYNKQWQAVLEGVTGVSLARVLQELQVLGLQQSALLPGNQHQLQQLLESNRAAAAPLIAKLRLHQLLEQQIGGGCGIGAAASARSGSRDVRSSSALLGLSSSELLLRLGVLPGAIGQAELGEELQQQLKELVPLVLGRLEGMEGRELVEVGSGGRTLQDLLEEAPEKKVGEGHNACVVGEGGVKCTHGCRGREAEEDGHGRGTNGCGVDGGPCRMLKRKVTEMMG